MATNFRFEIGKIGLFTFIRSPVIPKKIAISPLLFLNLVNVGPVIPEFTKVKDVHSVFSFFKINF